MARSMVRQRPPQRRRRCAAGAVLRAAWLFATALFLASLAATVNVAKTTATTGGGAEGGRNGNVDGGPPSEASSFRPPPGHRLRAPSEKATERAGRRAREEAAKGAGERKRPGGAVVRSSEGEGDEKEDGGGPSVGSTPPASDDEALLRWLRLRTNATSSSSASTYSQLLSAPVHFEPGALPFSQLSALKRCRADPAVYRKHFLERALRRVPYSEKHKLAYVMLPKSGSSTGRFMMKHEFDAVERQTNVNAIEHVIAFVREPTSRFYSQYEEAYARTAPWHSAQNKYQEGGGTPHPFPGLHEGFATYHDYEDAFCPPSTRKHRRECIYRPTQENGTLASRFSRFVRAYSGRDPFDVHLALQVPLLSDPSAGRAVKITELYNTADAEREWQLVAKRYLGEEVALEKAAAANREAKESGGVIKGRSFPRRLDKALVEQGTERRICELALLDYCCLNFELPQACRGDEGGRGGEGGSLQCKMEYDEENGGVVIGPAVHPQKGQR
ncbi:hypothetical protein ACHAWF_010990 [Thalassiosira exigua]